MILTMALWDFFRQKTGKEKMAIDIEKMNHLLSQFVTSTAEIQGASVVTTDGLPLSAALPDSMDEERVSAMSAAMLSLGDRIGNELARGEVERIFVEGKDGFGVLTSCGEDAVFLVLANKNSKQGVLMLEIKRTLEDLKLAF